MNIRIIPFHLFWIIPLILGTQFSGIAQIPCYGAAIFNFIYAIPMTIKYWKSGV